MAEVAYSSEKVHEGYLRINSCGKRDLKGKDYDTYRPDGRVDYSVQYIREGKCYAETEGSMEPAEAGSLILYFPGVRQHYIFREAEPSQLLWTHFSGNACELLEPLKKERAVIVKVRNRKEFERNFDKLIDSYYRKDMVSDALGQGYMTVLLGLIRDSVTEAGENGAQPIHEGLDKVLSHMLIYYYQPIDLDLYAGMCFVSKNRFIHLFKTKMGVPPYHYQLKIRMDRAKEMLENTAISVNECARMVGYSDVSYFCRIYRKYTGHSPGGRNG